MLRSLSSAAVVTACLALPAAAPAAWETPATVGPSGFNGDLALAPGGHLALSYERYDEGSEDGGPMLLADRSPGKAFTTVETGRTIHAQARVFGQGSGAISAFLMREDDIATATRPRGGAFGAFAPVTSAEDRPTAPSFAAAASRGGAQALAYSVSGMGVAVTVRTPGGTWSQPAVVGAAFIPALLGVSDDGQVIVAWTAPNGRLVANHRRANGDWGTPRDFGAVSRPALAMNAKGDAVIVFKTNTSWFVARRPADGAIPSAIGVNGVDANNGIDPVALAGDDGTLAAVLPHTYVDGDVQKVRMKYATIRDGVAPSTVDVPGSTELYGEPAAAIDAKGRPWIASSDVGRLELVRGGDDGSLGAPVAPAGEADAGYLRLAVDGEGGAAVSYIDLQQRTLHLTEWPGPVRDGDKPKDEGPKGEGPKGGGGGDQPKTEDTPPVVTPRAQPPVVPVLKQRLAALTISTRTKRASRVTFRLNLAATVTLTVERKRGKRWVATKIKRTLRAKQGANRTTLNLKALRRGRYRLVATVGTARTVAPFAVRR